jgi:hypothetical protein
VILMERESPEKWVQSYRSMFEYYRASVRPRYYWLLPWLSPTHARLARLHTQSIILSTASTTAVDDPQACHALWRAQYLHHNAAVRAMVPPEQLLVMQVGTHSRQRPGGRGLGPAVRLPRPPSAWHPLATREQVRGLRAGPSSCPGPAPRETLWTSCRSLQCTSGPTGRPPPPCSCCAGPPP